MEKKKVDYKDDFTEGDHSFKKWFSLQNKNAYILIFIIMITLLIFQLFNLDWCFETISSAFEDWWVAGLMVTFGNLIPIGGTIIVVYKGFIQFWKDHTHGRSR